MDRYQTELRNKNRGYMNMIVWQKAMDLFGLVWRIAYAEARIDFKLRAQFADAAQSIAATLRKGMVDAPLKSTSNFFTSHWDRLEKQ